MCSTIVFFSKIMVFFIGIGQSHLPAADGPADETTQFVRSQKYQFTDDLGNGVHPPVFITLDHGEAEKNMSNDAERMHFVVPEDKKIGLLHETMVDSYGNLHTIGELFYNKPETEMIKNGILMGEKWGLSFGTDFEEIVGQGRVASKRFTHLGITKDPEFGPEGTWIKVMTDNTRDLHKIIQEHYLNVPGLYASPKTRARYNLPERPMLKKMTVGASANKPEIYTSEQQTVIPKDAVLLSSPNMLSSTMTTNDGVSINLSPPKEGSAPSNEQLPAPTLNGNVPYKVDSLNLPLQPNAFHLAKQAEHRQIEDMVQIRDTQTRVVQSLNADASKLLDNLNFNDPETFLDNERLMAIGRLQDEYNKAIELAGWRPTEYPIGVKRRTGQIDEYLEKMMAVLTKEADETHKSAEDKRLAQAMIEDPLKYRSMLISTMAGAKSKIANQRANDERLKKDREYADEKAANEKKFAEMKESNERAEKRIREYEERDTGAKRQRTETPVGTYASNLGSSFNSAPTEALSTGASRGDNAGVRKEGLISVSYDTDVFWNRYALDGNQALKSVHTGFGKGIDITDVAALMLKAKQVTKDMPIDGPPRYKF